jgi:hypothetical protein
MKSNGEAFQTLTCRLVSEEQEVPSLPSNNEESPLMWLSMRKPGFLPHVLVIRRQSLPFSWKKSVECQEKWNQSFGLKAWTPGIPHAKSGHSPFYAKYRDMVKGREKRLITGPRTHCVKRQSKHSAHLDPSSVIDLNRWRTGASGQGYA